MSVVYIDKTLQKNSVSMTEPHSHEYYELYFLIGGTRTVFVENKMFYLEKNSFVIVPPYTMHKTEGGPFDRINITVSPDRLTDGQRDYLTAAYEATAFAIGEKYLDMIVKLLSEGADILLTMQKGQTEFAASLTNIALTLLEAQDNIPIVPKGETVQGKESSEVLKIIQYLNENYERKISLTQLCDEFYLSKASLCKKFKKVMCCSIMDYLLKVRLKHAQRLLRKTRLSIDRVAQKCGFSSTNYFRNIFKKSLGISPYKFRYGMPT